MNNEIESTPPKLPFANKKITYFTSKMKNFKTIIITYWLSLLIVILFLSGVLSYFLVPTQSLTDFLTFMAGFSTIILAILTGIYVITTTRQLDVMKKQLNEMEYSRSLQTQPLPIIKNIKCTMENPKVFWEPPDKKIVVVKKIKIKGQIINIGVGSAVSVDIIPKIICEYPNSNILLSTSKRLDFLEENLPTDYEEIFNEDKGKIIEVFLERDISSFPVLELTIHYKNVLGGFFKALYRYRIFPYKKDFGILKTWLKNMKMFEVDFSESLEEYDSLVKVNIDKATEIYDKIESKFNENAGTSELDFILNPIPSSFFVKPLTEREYYSEIEKEKIWYGTFLGDYDETCIKL